MALKTTLGNGGRSKCSARIATEFGKSGTSGTARLAFGHASTASARAKSIAAKAIKSNQNQRKSRMLHDPKREAEIEFEIKVAKEPWRKIWLEAAELLREGGHCRGMLQNERGERCALGAIYGVDPEPDRVCGSAASQAAILLGRYVNMPVAIWNDHNSTETVITTLELLARS